MSEKNHFENDYHQKIERTDNASFEQLSDQQPILPLEVSEQELEHVIASDSKEESIQMERMGQIVYFMEANKFWMGQTGGSEGWKRKTNWLDYDPEAIRCMTGEGVTFSERSKNLGWIHRQGRHVFDRHGKKKGDTRFGGKGYPGEGWLIFGPYPHPSISHSRRRLPTLGNLRYKAKYTFFVDTIGVPDNQVMLVCGCSYNKGNNIIKKLEITPAYIRQLQRAQRKQVRPVTTVTVEITFGDGRTTYPDFETRIWWTGKGRAAFGTIQVYQWS